MEIQKLKKENEIEYRNFSDVKEERIFLDKELTGLLLSKVNLAYGTEINEILLSALCLSINKWQKHKKIAVSLEGHGREAIFDEMNIDRTVGWFTSIYPVILSVDSTLEEHIINNKEHIRKIPNKGIDYGILRYIKRESDSIFSFNPEIVFNYLGSFEQSFEDNVLDIAKESSGNAVSPDGEQETPLDLSGLIAAGQLVIAIKFHKKEFSENSMKKLLGYVKESLEEIIYHCSKKDNKQLTPSDLTYKKLSLEQLKKLSKQYEIEDIYPLSPMQEGMLFHHLFDSESEAYFEQMSYRLKGKIDLTNLKSSFLHILKMHDILRSNFINDIAERPLQIVRTNTDNSFYSYDIRNVENQEDYLLNFKEKEKSQSFDLANDQLMKLSVLQLENSVYEIIWTNHHILMDGWCLSILTKDFFTYYQHLNYKQEYKAKKVRPFKDYIIWLEKQNKNDASEYWESYLNDINDKAEIPGKVKYNNKLKKEIKNLEISLSVNDTKKVQTFISNNNLTINSYLQFVWAFSLYKFSQSNNVIFGSVVSGRPSEIDGIEEMIGLFINTRPIRLVFDESSNIVEAMKLHLLRTQEGENKSFFPLAEIQSKTDLKQNLIDHILVFQNFPVSDQIQKSANDNFEFEITNVEAFEEVNYDFSILASLSKFIKISISYNDNAFDENILTSFLKFFERMLLEICKDNYLKLSDINLLSDSEEIDLLNNINKSSIGFRSDKTIVDLFEEAVSMHPDNIAVSYENKNLRYKELNETANRIAHSLKKKIEIKKDDVFAVLMGRSENMIISILAILKTGAAYLPIDPEYPLERKKYMIDDSAAVAILSDQNIIEGYENRFIEFENLNFELESPLNLDKKISPNDLIYVIYTSGSTGKPKGAMLEHRGLVNMVQDQIKSLNINSEDHILQYASISFDASVYEIFQSLLSGAKLCIPNSETRMDLKQLSNYLKSELISVTILPPVISPHLDFTDQNSLRLIISGGDVFNKQVLKNNIQFLNAYGPTEASVCVSNFLIPKNYSEKTIPIGKAISNVKLYIIDKNQKLSVKGAIGELAISGPSLARGYINQDELTSKTFVKNPYSQSDSDKILYLTGDLVRYLPDGNIEYIGRKDNQIKHRGHRIELGEIEAAIANIKDVKQAVVFHEKDNDVLFSLIESTEKINTNAIKATLTSAVPSYMVPSRLILVDKFPITSNGKVDRKKLYRDYKDKLLSLSKHITPKTKTEKRLVEICEETLEKNKVGINDNFFELGGHSIKAMLLVSKVNSKFNVAIKLKDLFANPILENFAKHIDKLKHISNDTIERLPIKPDYELSSSQRRIWMIDQIQDNSLEYIMTFEHIANEIFEPKLVQDTLKILLDRHETLRTSFHSINGEPRQKIHKNLEIPVEWVNLKAEKDPNVSFKEHYIKACSQGFDLKTSPLFRVLVYEVSEKKSILVYIMHHIVSDGLSLQILSNELIEIYSKIKKKEEIKLKPVAIQYKDFAAWQNKRLANNNDKDYWLSKLSGELPVISLPYDGFISGNSTAFGASYEFKIKEETKQVLENLASKEQASLYMILLAAYNIRFIKSKFAE